ncbi:MAG: LON peptidase substrate-binding domain-containing protein [Acidimicrobiia bacterium]|nr:LON peptidase substrate-binding domain-containing protein [Acidimicrobiia bacterium]NNF89672.1 LON peptidase substrate-binding domain-containing protein [Acidimicrobiia bacterium]NNJ47278.1 LON peptidase substrate-binding domain-containing protein [Acidimicrobiia bacterium]NNL14167.1 LON peptidase substrate-binding domain-containing protein [Acidimicrobiia bacterium]
MEELVLFSRGRVLLPGQRLKLRVHDVELSAALRGVDEFCAVFSQSGGELSRVGVRADIRSRSIAPYDRLDIDVVGGDRLEIPTSARPHDGTVGVAVVEEQPGDGDIRLLRDELERGVQRFAAAAAESGRPASISSVLHRDPTLASYQVATVLPLSHPERQELLEIETTTERLEQELRIAAGETGVLRHLLGLGRMGA